MDKEKEGEPRLGKGLRMMGLNGSEYRTITSNRPNIDIPLTDPKKGNGQHGIEGVFSKKEYQYNDALTTAYIMLEEKASVQKKDIFFITVTLDDETNLKLRRQDADDSKEPMIRSVSRWLRAYDYITDAIVVIEECPDSVVKHENGEYRRLHLHMITMLNDNERTMAQSSLLRDKSTRVHIKDTWLDKRSYTDFDEWEEEEFGSIPVNAVDSDAKYWLNTYLLEKVSKTSGEVTKIICRQYPVCLRGVDYMTKGIQEPIGRGRNYTLVGIKGLTKRREELYRLAREL